MHGSKIDRSSCSSPGSVLTSVGISQAYLEFDQGNLNAGKVGIKEFKPHSKISTSLWFQPSTNVRSPFLPVVSSSVLPPEVPAGALTTMG